MKSVREKISKFTQEYESVDNCDLHHDGYEALIKLIEDDRLELRKEIRKYILAWENLK